MKKTTVFLATAAACLPFWLASCGGDDEAPDEASGGSAGTGGSVGGSAGEGNTDSGGSGGTSTTGSATGGSAGATSAGGGSGGTAGSGGTTTTGAAGQGGAAGDTSGGAGEGGAAGSPSEELLSCNVGCENDDDCATEAAEARHCDSELGRCVECRADADCLARASLWLFECSAEAPCAFVGEVCVDVNGTGYCAAPVTDAGCVYGGVPLEAVEFTTGDPVEVCGSSAGRCENYRCFTGCTDTEDACTVASPGQGDICDAATGKCTCQNDDECWFGPGRCNPVTQRCDECAENADCADAVAGRECVAGRCGCSGTEACPTAVFPDGTPVCE